MYLDLVWMRFVVGKWFKITRRFGISWNVGEDDSERCMQTCLGGLCLFCVVGFGRAFCERPGGVRRPS